MNLIIACLRPTATLRWRPVTFMESVIIARLKLSRVVSVTSEAQTW